MIEVLATRPRRKGLKKLLTALADLVWVPTLRERSELKGMRKEHLTYFRQQLAQDHFTVGLVEVVSML